MKTYYVSLDRAQERRIHIQRHLALRQLDAVRIEAVDGEELTREQLEVLCDMGRVDRLRHWLTNGAIACALSHKRAYEQMLQQGDRVAFIVEDDIWLPEDIGQILEAVEEEIGPDEIILLMITSSLPAAFSRVGMKQLWKGGPGLCYPMDLSQTVCAAAYCIGRSAAEGLLRVNTPVAAVADSWRWFHNNGAFASLRVLHPTRVTTMNFKSSIGYLSGLGAGAATLIDRLRPPFLHNWVARRREQLLMASTGNFHLVDDPSPYMPT